MGIYQFNTPYVRDSGRIFAPIYVPGENYSFYFNSDTIIDDVNWNFFIARIIDINGNVLSDILGIGDVGTCFLNPSIYNLYIQNFVFPSINDCFAYIVIDDTKNGNEVARSNVIQICNNPFEVTAMIKFRHDDQLYGVRYDLLNGQDGNPNFYQLFRLPINMIGKPEPRSEREQYRQSSDGRELRNSKSFRDVVLTLEMYWCSDEDLLALSALNEHSEVYINDKRLILLTQIKVEKPPAYSNLGKATFEAIVRDFDIDTNLLENYGETIFWGGSIYANINTFVEA